MVCWLVPGLRPNLNFGFAPPPLSGLTLGGPAGTSFSFNIGPTVAAVPPQGAEGMPFVGGNIAFSLGFSGPPPSPPPEGAPVLRGLGDQRPSRQQAQQHAFQQPHDGAHVFWYIQQYASCCHSIADGIHKKGHAGEQPQHTAMMGGIGHVMNQLLGAAGSAPGPAGAGGGNEEQAIHRAAGDSAQASVAAPPNQAAATASGLVTHGSTVIIQIGGTAVPIAPMADHLGAIPGTGQPPIAGQVVDGLQGLIGQLLSGLLNQAVEHQGAAAVQPGPQATQPALNVSSLVERIVALLRPVMQNDLISVISAATAQLQRVSAHSALETSTL